MTQRGNRNMTLRIQNLEKRLDSASLLLTMLLFAVMMISILKSLLHLVLPYQPHILPSLVVLRLLLLIHLHLNMTFAGLLLLLLSSVLLTRTINKSLSLLLHSLYVYIPVFFLLHRLWISFLYI